MASKSKEVYQSLSLALMELHHKYCLQILFPKSKTDVEKLEWFPQRVSKEVKEYRKNVEGIGLVQPGKEKAAMV